MLVIFAPPTMAFADGAVPKALHRRCSRIVRRRHRLLLHSVQAAASLTILIRGA
jgi:hypothetical protein